MDEFHTAGSFTVSATVAINYTPPPTVQQLSKLALDAYAAAPSGGDGYALLPNPPSIPGDNGFGATAYVQGDPSSGGQIVIAARGTSTLSDNIHAYTFLSDTSFLTGNPNFALQSQVAQLANFVSQVATEYPTAQITLDGYSLGGALAQIVGSYANVQTITFNSPGAKQFVPSFSNTLSFLQGQAILTPANVVADYRSVGDLVSLYGTQTGTQISVVNPLLNSLSG